MTVWVVELWKTSGTPVLVKRWWTEQATFTYATTHDPGAGTHTYEVKAEPDAFSASVGDRNMIIGSHKR